MRRWFTAEDQLNGGASVVPVGSERLLGADDLAVVGETIEGCLAGVREKDGAVDLLPPLEPLTARMISPLFLSEVDRISLVR